MHNIILNNHQFELLKESVKERLEAERKEVNTEPSEKQCKAGNYAMGHISINGFEITIENPKGSYRKGKDRNGKEWKTLMHNDYGYFTKTVGKDGDAIDVFLGPYIEDKELKFYPIDQYINGEFDETKVMMGFRDKESAKKAYLSNYEKDWKGFKYITEVDEDTFKKWLYDGYRQRKPFAKYVTLTENLNLNENRKNDKNENIPTKCNKCGGKINLEIHGEPVYVYSECGKYFGTMPCNINEGMINEKFNSKKLAQYAKEHGGIETSINGGRREGANAWQRGRSIDLSQVTDEMLDGEPFMPEKWSDEPNAVCFKDGSMVRLKKYGEMPAPEKKAKISKYGTGIGDTGNHNKHIGGFKSQYSITQHSAPYNGYAVSDRAGKAQNYRNALKNNHEIIDYFKNHPEREDGTRQSRESQNIIDKIHSNIHNDLKEGKMKRNIILTEEQFNNFINQQIEEGKKNNPPKDEVAAINKANREEDIKQHGKSITFRTTIEKNPKAYNRKVKHKESLDESKKIYMTEEQFKNYCRIMLQEKRKTDYVKDLLKESMEDYDGEYEEIPNADFICELPNGEYVTGKYYFSIYRDDEVNYTEYNFISCSFDKNVSPELEKEITERIEELCDGDRLDFEL